MKQNLILISFLERIYKAKRSEDFSNLLEVQIELNRLDKENRLLRDMVKDKTEVNIKMESKAHISASKRLKLENRVDILEQEKERLKTELNNINENLEL